MAFNLIAINKLCLTGARLLIDFNAFRHVQFIDMLNVDHSQILFLILLLHLEIIVF